ncbi:MAG TPA: discoidin domain-containing protein [Planctomycetota bacterium]|jgi:hypothetical protein
MNAEQVTQNGSAGPRIYVAQPTGKEPRRALRVFVTGFAALSGFYLVPILTPSLDSLPTARKYVKPVYKPIKPPPKTELPAAAKVSLNYALAANGATAVGGSEPGQLIDGNDTNYTSGSGYAMTQWRTDPPPAFIITLKEPTTIDCIRILLWDRSEDRFYRYKLEVRADTTSPQWTMVADRSGPNEQCRSWQKIQFPARAVQQIRLTGTYNSANAGFHVVEVQAYNGVPPDVKVAPVESLDF